MRIFFSLGSVLTAVSLASMSVAAVADDAPVNRGAKPNGPVQSAGVEPQVAAPLPNPMELIYVPVTPCRAFGGQALAVNQIKPFFISGVIDMRPQGGPAAGCGVPATASAVTINLSAGVSTAGGYLTSYATGTPRPNMASLNYKTNPATSGSVVALGTDGTISVFASGATRVSGDITGYFLPQIQVYMNSNGSAYAATTRIISTEKLGTGSYRIVTDRNLQLCSIHVNIDGGYYYGSGYPSGTSIYVQTWGISSGTATAIDLYHNVSAKC